MKVITHNGEQFLLLDWLPNWSRPYRVTIRRPVHVERSVSAQEVRRSTADTIRVTQEFRCLLVGEAARAAEEALSTITNETVAVPFWPAIRFERDGIGSIRSGVYLAVSEDFSATEVFDVHPPEWALAHGLVVPLLFGRLNSRSTTWETPSLLSVSISHTDTGSASGALTVEPRTWEFGPSHNPGIQSRRALFPFRFDWTAPSQDAAVPMETAEIGFGRGREEIVWGNPSRSFSAESVAASRDDAARLIAFFFDHSSELAFWVSSNAERFALTQNVPAGSMQIPSPNHGCVSGEWLAFSTGGQIEGFGRVAEAGNDGVTLAEPIGALFAGDTLVQRMALVRFRSDALTIDFTSPDYATARCDFVELEPEADSESEFVGGREIGTTPPRVWLYEFTAGSFVEKWTSHESPVEIGGQTFEPATIGHGDIVSSVNGSRDSVTISVGISASQIVRAALARSVYGRVKVQVAVANRIGGAARSARIIFSGEVESLRSSGASIALTCKPWPGLSEVRIGRFRLQPTCNHILYSEGCGVPDSAMRHDATVTTPGGRGWPYVFGLTALARHSGDPLAISENWFAGGWIEIGADKVQIRSSTEPHSGVLSVTLSRDPLAFPSAGDAVALYPGCDGRWDTCRSKFANRLNFGGHPHIPVSNPSLVKLSSAANGGKK